LGPPVISPGSSCSYQWTFTPSTVGPINGTITIISDDPDENPLYISLTGNGFVPQRGDVDGDGSITVLDVLAAVNHILRTITLTGDALRRADCTGDGSIDILDVIGIVNVILGTGQCAPGACRSQVTPEVMEFLESLDHYLAAEDFDRFMALVKTETGVPVEYSLGQNYPNPFNPSTIIKYSIAKSVHTTLKIYNILGQEVRTLVNEIREPGFYTITWNSRDDSGTKVASGVYFYRLSMDGGRWSETKRMVLMK
jgi:hypothetical protein